MNKFKLTIDVDRINLENENHIRNFSQKIKNLAQHCVNYINSIDNNTDCSKKRFLPEIHDDENDSTIDNQYIYQPLAHDNKNINYDFLYYEHDSLIIPS